MKTNKELCEWLRQNSSGIYRTAAEAAGEIERLENENKTLAEEVRKLRNYRSSVEEISRRNTKAR